MAKDRPLQFLPGYKIDQKKTRAMKQFILNFCLNYNTAKSLLAMAMSVNSGRWTLHTAMEIDIDDGCALDLHYMWPNVIFVSKAK